MSVSLLAPSRLHLTQTLKETLQLKGFVFSFSSALSAHILNTQIEKAGNKNSIFLYH